MLFALIPLAYGTSAFPCSCLPPGPPSEALEWATAVFLGRVEEITTAKIPLARGERLEERKVLFSIQKSWKGKQGKTLTIFTNVSGASCGYPFRVGQEYLVYAYGAPPRLHVSLCSRTQMKGKATEKEIAELNRASKKR
jgi:hypothetical protein